MARKWIRPRKDGLWDRAGSADTATPTGDGWQEVDDATFQGTRDAEARRDASRQAEEDFRAGATKAGASSGDADFEALQHIASGQPEKERGPADWAADDFRAGAPKVGRADGYGDAKRDGLSNPAARPDMTAMDGPRNPSPMPRAGMKASPKRPSIAVSAPAADRTGAGRLPTVSATPQAAQKALPAETTAEVTRAVDPYGDARAQANRNRLGAQLARAGGMVNEALSGARLDRAAYDDLEAQSEQPVADFAARREMGRQDASDAASLEERRLRAEDYARRWASGDREFQYRQGRDKADDARRDAASLEDMRRFDAQQRGAAADRALRRSEVQDRRTDMEEGRNERARLAREAAQQQQSEKALQTLGQQTSKLPIGELQQALESIDAQAPGLAYGKAPKELPMGTWDAMARSVPYGAGEWAMSDEGKKYAATISQLRDIVMRMRSGAAIKDSEAKQYLALLGDNVLSNPQKAAEGINAVREGLAQRLNNIQAPYVRGGTLDEYERQGGSSFRAPIFSGSQTQNTVEAKPTGRTVTMPDGRVFDVLDNGKARPRG